MLKQSFYSQREQAIPFTSKIRLIIVPILLSLLLMMIVPLIRGLFFPASPENEPPITLSSTIDMILTVGISLIVITKTSKIKIKDLGLGFTKVFSKIFIGVVSGLIAISVVAFFINILGGTNSIYNFKPEYLKILLLGLIFFTFQSTSEELIYRGYLMPHFSKSIGIFWSILLSSVLFTLLHALNPGITIMPIINLMLASIVFSLIYYKTGNLWLVGFAHAVWNFSQGLIYGSMVSGLALKESVFKSLPIENNELISGGEFGFEGSIVTSILGVVLIVLLIISILKSKNKNLVK